jgi:peptidoglycan/xylan/chitin deacetylase (PgdA/CDA1 family)
MERISANGVRWYSPRQLARAAMLRLAGRNRMFERGARSDAVYLTFDDGPHPEYTPRLLDVLATSDAKATFFVVGQQCEKYPEIVRRIVGEGHQIGNHTFFHRLPREVSATDLLDEVERTRGVIRQIVGSDCRLFRPPYGALTLSKMKALWRCEQTIALWSVDPRDYKCSSLEVLRWLRDYPAEGGDVVLLHDVHATAAEAMPTIVESIRRQEYELAALAV